MNEEKFAKIVLEAYRELYKHSTPSADFDRLIESGVTRKPEWFLNFFLEEEKQVEIINSVLNKYNLKNHERQSIRQCLLLGCAPSGSKNGKRNKKH